VSTMIRIDKETRNELLLITLLEKEKSMAKMIKLLIEHYKKSKEELEK